MNEDDIVPEEPRLAAVSDEVPEQARQVSEVEKLGDLLNRLDGAQDVETLRALVMAQTVLAMQEQQQAMVADHNLWVAEVSGLVARLENVLERNRSVIVEELAELLFRKRSAVA